MAFAPWASGRGPRAILLRVRRSTYHLPGMDCDAEERLVRMRLEPLPEVRALTVDLDARTVAVDHDGPEPTVGAELAALALGARLRASGPAPANVGTAAPDPAAEARQRRTLWTVLAINATFFVVEITAGLVFDSMALIADALDMLADAMVYALSLAAVGATVAFKRNAARVAGALQAVLALVGFAEVLRRFFGAEAMPDGAVMIPVAAAALVANVICLVLLRRLRSGEPHLRASVIFTSNDVVIAIGVIVAGAGVLLTGSAWPDLVVGGIVFAVVARGAWRILRLAS